MSNVPKDFAHGRGVHGSASEAADNLLDAASQASDRVRESTDHLRDAAGHAAARTAESLRYAAQKAKPKLRGWIHSFTAPVAFVGGIVLVALAPPSLRFATIVFAISGFVLFTMSAIYHRGTWNERTFTLLRRLDHSNVFLLIAGTYTPLSVAYLDTAIGRTVLAIVWGGALAGITLKFVWINAPRWLYVPVYIALGWVAVWFLPDFWDAGGPAIVWLLLGGGIAYTLGALAYALKRPNPAPAWFGFHEIFHVGTVIGWGCHFIAVLLTLLAF